MSDLAHLEAGRKRDFVIAEYDSHGYLISKPAYLPCGSHDGACRVQRYGTQHRQTGPGHPLAVLRCCEHRRCFRVYPPGYVPFARQPLVCDPCSVEGSLFDAALDAAQDLSWPQAFGEPSFHTQRRQIQRAAAWLGLCAPPRISEQAVIWLGVLAADWSKLRALWPQAKGYRASGRVIRRFCEVMMLSTLRPLLKLGFHCGVCGQPWEICSGVCLIPI